MKHSKCVCVFFVVLALVLPVSAANDCFTFYFCEGSVFYSATADFWPSVDDRVFDYDGILPEDSYSISFDLYDGSCMYHFKSTDSIDLVWGTVESDGVFFHFFEGVIEFEVTSNGGSEAAFYDFDLTLFSQDEVGLTRCYLVNDPLYELVGFDVDAIYFEPISASASGIGIILDSFGTISRTVSDTFSIIISNPALTVTTGGGLTGVGVYIYKRLRRGV